MAGIRNEMEQDWLRVCTVQQSCCTRVELPREYATNGAKMIAERDLASLPGSVVDTTP